MLVCTDNGDINLCSRDKAFFPNDLQLKEFYKGAPIRLNFVPNEVDRNLGSRSIPPKKMTS